MKLIPVGLDLGSSQTKCVALARRDCFASAITVQKANQWNESAEKITVGDDAIRSSQSYNSDTVFPISLGRPTDESGYLKLAEHALSNMGLYRNAENVCLVVGLPYETAKKRDEIKYLLESKLKVKKCLVETQARGTLRTMEVNTGIVINIGFGTTEAVIFDDGVVVAGDSLHVAVRTIVDGLNSDGIRMERTLLTDIAMYEKYEKESRVHAAAIADAISRWYKEKMISAKHEYDVIVSGGGINNNSIKNALKKTGLPFRVPDDPLYSNAYGHYMRAVKNC